MQLPILRLHDTARIPTAQQSSQTLPTIAFETLLELLELADTLHISRSNKFLIRTYYLKYLLASPDLYYLQVDLFHVALTCAYLALQIAGTPQEISDFLHFLIHSQHASHFLSEQHQALITQLHVINSASLTTPYDFIQIAKSHVFTGNFQRVAINVIDLALTLPEAANVSAEQLFVASCMFIGERTSNESLKNLMEGEFNAAMGVGSEMKIVLSQAFQALLQGQP